MSSDGAVPLGRKELSAQEWEGILRELFSIKRGKVRIPHEPELSYKEAVVSDVEVDLVSLPRAVAVLQAMAPALRSMTPQALQTLFWIAAQPNPTALSTQDLEGIVDLEEIVGQTMLTEIDRLIDEGHSGVVIAEHLSIPVEWVDREERTRQN